MECSSTYRRFSMNTSLKNARIFDDDSWDAESAGFIIKKEPIEPEKEEETNNSFNESVTVKKEITEDTYNSSLEECAGPYEPSYPDNLNLNVKTEVFEPTTKEKSAKDVDKKEIRDIPNDANKINWSFAHFRHGNTDVKDEAEDDFDEDSMFEESYLDNIDPKVKKEIISTPNKFDKGDWPTEDSNPSPFNKELFKNFSLKQEENDSPDLRERIFQSSGSKAKKEARKNFLASPRISPYRRSSVGDAVANRLSVKKRLGPQLPSDIPKSESKQEARRNYSLSRSPRNSPYRKGSVGETAPHPISVKRRLGPRDTPNYKHEENRGPELREKSQQRSNSPEIQEARKQFSSSVSAKKRLGPALSSDIPKKKPCKQEMETDPEILSRRQKQIDYGKNTMGYDNYIKKVPRQERTREDPQTPNRFVKYSRRGWDGLIKQWRIKLHKYDTADS